MKVGQGVYVKAKESKLTGKIIPQIDSAEIGKSVAKNLILRFCQAGTNCGIMKARQHKFQAGKLLLLTELF